MRFEWLTGLWFGLTLPAIVLMHLLKRKYVDTTVPSHLLWNRVLNESETNRPWQKLRNRLLLFLQLMFAALLVLSLLGPYVMAHRGAKPHVVVVLDRSASMLAVTDGSPADGGGDRQTRFDEARRELVRWLRREARGSAVTLLAMGEQPELMLSRERDIGRLERTLSGLTPSHGRTAYAETLSLAAALTRNDADAEVRLFTDGQIIESVPDDTFSVPVTVVRVGGQDVPNVGVVQFGAKIDASGRTAEAVATFRNWGTAPRTTDISLYADGQLAQVRRETLAPGERKSVYFSGLPEADVYKVELRAGDALRHDDTAFAFAAGERRIRVLLVGPGNLFLEKALQLIGTEVTKLLPEHADGWLSNDDGRAEPDLVVLDSADPSAALTGSSARRWTDLLASKPVWMIGAGYDGESKPIRGGDYTVADHPVTRYVRFQHAHVAEAIVPRSVPWGNAIVSRDGVPLVYAGTERGQPRLLFAFDLTRTDLPLRIEFPVLVQNAVQWLQGGQHGNLGKGIAGERREIALAAETAEARWIPVDPAGVYLPADTRDGAVSATQTLPLTAGLYRFEERNGSGETIASRYIEVTVDPRESDLSAEPDLAFAGGESPHDGAATPSFSPHPLLPWIAAAALVIALLEWEVYRRGASL